MLFANQVIFQVDGHEVLKNEGNYKICKKETKRKKTSEPFLSGALFEK